MIWSVASSPTGSVVAVAGRYGRSQDGRISLYNAETGDEVTSLLWPDEDLVALTFAPSGTQVAVADATGHIAIWRLREGQEKPEERLTLIKRVAPSAVTNDLLFNRDASLLALACADGILRLFDVLTGTVTGELRGHTAGVSALAFSPDGTFLASAGGSDGTIRIWDLTDKTLRLTLEHGAADVTDVTFGSDGQWVVGSYGDSYHPAPKPWVTMEYPNKQVRVWEASTGELVRSFRIAGDRVTSVSFGPGSKRITVGYTYKRAGFDNAVAVIDIHSGERQCTVRGGRAPLTTWCGSSERLVTADGRFIAVWDVANAAEPQRLWQKEWRWKGKIPRFSEPDAAGG